MKQARIGAIGALFTGAVLTTAGGTDLPGKYYRGKAEQLPEHKIELQYMELHNKANSTQESATFEGRGKAYIEAKVGYWYTDYGHFPTEYARGLEKWTLYPGHSLPQDKVFKYFPKVTFEDERLKELGKTISAICAIAGIALSTLAAEALALQSLKKDLPTG